MLCPPSQQHPLIGWLQDDGHAHIDASLLNVQWDRGILRYWQVLDGTEGGSLDVTRQKTNTFSLRDKKRRQPSHGVFILLRSSLHMHWRRRRNIRRPSEGAVGLRRLWRWWTGFSLASSSPPPHPDHHHWSDPWCSVNRRAACESGRVVLLTCIQWSGPQACTDLDKLRRLWSGLVPPQVNQDPLYLVHHVSSKKIWNEKVTKSSISLKGQVQPLKLCTSNGLDYNRRTEGSIKHIFRFVKCLFIFVKTASFHILESGAVPAAPGELWPGLVKSPPGRSQQVSEGSGRCYVWSITLGLNLKALVCRALPGKYLCPHMVFTKLVSWSNEPGSEESCTGSPG